VALRWFPVTEPRAANLRPGERATIACLAVDREQAGIVHGYIVGHFREILAVAAMVTKESKNGLELNNGVDILVVTSNYRAARGKSYQVIIFDEVAFWRDEETSTNPDKEIYRGLRPGMATLPNSMLIGIASTHKRAGLAYDRYAQYFGKNSDRYLVVHAPSTTLNPTLDQEEIDAAFADDPAAARADYFSEWRDDLAGYIPRDLIEGAVDQGIQVRPYRPGINYLAFDDTAEGVSPAGDSFCAAIAHKDGDELILDWCVEHKPPFNTAAVTHQIAEVLKAYRISQILGDAHSVGFSTNEYARHGIKRLESCELSKSELYLEVLPAFSAGRIRLLANDRVVSQFCSLERRTIVGAADKVDHPRGAHDDLANAVAGALWRAASKTGKLNITQETLHTMKASGHCRASRAGFSSTVDTYRMALFTRRV
jgi:hypothetical protein